jgi:hypothetical protein
VTAFDTAIVFTGHMVDLPERETPRFPPAMEPLAAEAIRARLADLRAGDTRLIGIASGARGGDILFHEACAALGIAARLVLPFHPDAFFDASVRGVPGSDWEARFEAIWRAKAGGARTVLGLDDAPDPFGACNDAMLAMARDAAARVVLLALWDGAGAVKQGGTAAFAEQVREGGGEVIQIDTKALLARL